MVYLTQNITYVVVETIVRFVIVGLIEGKRLIKGRARFSTQEVLGINHIFIQQNYTKTDTVTDKIQEEAPKRYFWIKETDRQANMQACSLPPKKSTRKPAIIKQWKIKSENTKLIATKKQIIVGGKSPND